MSDDSPDHSRNLASISFGDSLQKVAKAKEKGATTSLAGADETIEGLISQFEEIAQIDDDGNQFWFARDLQILLGYAKWDNFLGRVDKRLQP